MRRRAEGHRRRDLTMEITGALAIVVLGTVVAIARNPDAPLVERAAAWPLVGPAVQAIQERWRRPRVSPEPPPASTPPLIVRLPTPDDHEREGPPVSAPARTGDGLAPAGPASGPPSDPVVRIADGPAPVLPLPGRPADPLRLARIREALRRQGELRQRSVGPYSMIGDLDLEECCSEWTEIAAASEAAWMGRYGVRPLGRPLETVVLVGRTSTYRELAWTLFPGGPEADGLSAYGLVLIPAEGRSRSELAATFQHELGHLLARRSLGPELPAWLAEGLAEDFGQAPLDGRGGFDFSRWRGEAMREGLRFEISGGLAGLDRLARAAASGEVPGLSELAAIAEPEFAVGDAGALRYAAAAAWIRFLLAEPARAAASRAYLAEVGRGRPPTLAGLERSLGRPATAFDGELADWLVAARRRELTRVGLPVAWLDAQPGDSSRQRESPSP